MSFEGAPVLRVGELPDEWILDEPLVYVTEAGGRLTVPQGFVTDLASIPRLLYTVIPVNGKHRSAAILHDWLYETQRLSREACDALFLEAMGASGVRWSLRWAMYMGVRVGGWVSWNSRRRRNRQQEK